MSTCLTNGVIENDEFLLHQQPAIEVCLILYGNEFTKLSFH